MKCFYHVDRDAVAMCKSCGRGICPECVSDVPPGVACRDRCEREVAALNLVIRRNQFAYQKAGASWRRNAIVLLLAGLLFGGMGVLPWMLTGNVGPLFMVPLGCLFLLWAYFSYRSGKQIAEIEPGPPDAGPSPKA